MKIPVIPAVVFRVEFQWYSSFRWKIFGKKVIPSEVLPFSRWNGISGNFCTICPYTWCQAPYGYISAGSTAVAADISKLSTKWYGSIKIISSMWNVAVPFVQKKSTENSIQMVSAVVLKVREVVTELSKVIRVCFGFASVRLVIGLKISCHFFSQSD